MKKLINFFPSPFSRKTFQRNLSRPTFSVATLESLTLSRPTKYALHKELLVASQRGSQL